MSLANVVAPVGIAQDAVAVALERSQATLGAHVAALQARRDLIAAELTGPPFGMPAGGWSLLLRVSDFALDGEQMAGRLLAQGVCATPMSGWGETHGRPDIRFVFANETLGRLRGLGARVRVAIGA